MINEHTLAVEVAKLEGGKEEANIAEVSQIVNIILHKLAEYPLEEVAELLKRNSTTKEPLPDGFEGRATGREGDRV